MNRKYLGDSYDLVKRFFTTLLSYYGYEVFVEPFFTDKDNWKPEDRRRYYKLIDAKPHRGRTADGRTALLMDPDTGIGRKKTPRHVTTEDIAERLHHHQYGLVVVFDQSFKRTKKREIKKQMKDKLSALQDKKVSCFYYDSHARFLFASLDRVTISRISDAIIRTGIPSDRIIHLRCGRRRR